MDVALVIRQRLEELELDQRDLARAASVTESYVSQILTRKKAPPAPDRTDIYDRMDRFLKLPQGELARAAEVYLKEERRRRLRDPAPPFSATFNSRSSAGAGPAPCQRCFRACAGCCCANARGPSAKRCARSSSGN